MADIKKHDNICIVGEDDSIVSMDKWNGECWETLFNWFADNLPDVNPLDLLAAFIKKTLMGDNHE